MGAGQSLQRLSFDEFDFDEFDFDIKFFLSYKVFWWEV